MRRLCALSVAAVITAAGSAFAADDEGNFAIKGAGFAACPDYVEAYDSGSTDLLAYRSWLNGFVTGHNLLLPGTYDVAPVLSLDALSGVMADICRNNAEFRFAEAAVILIVDMEALRLAASSPMIELTEGDLTVEVPAEFVSRAQSALQELGLYQGAIDGIYGPGTRAAFSAFQEAEEIEVTGLPDTVTLVRLLIR